MRGPSTRRVVVPTREGMGVRRRSAFYKKKKELQKDLGRGAEDPENWRRGGTGRRRARIKSENRYIRVFDSAAACTVHRVVRQGKERTKEGKWTSGYDALCHWEGLGLYRKVKMAFVREIDSNSGLYSPSAIKCPKINSCCRSTVSWKHEAPEFRVLKSMSRWGPDSGDGCGQDARRALRWPQLDAPSTRRPNAPDSLAPRANTASSRANTATNNFRVRSHPRRCHPAQVKSKNDANEQLARQLTRRLEDVQDGTENLRLDLATAEDLLLAANAHRQELVEQVASAEEAHEEEVRALKANIRHLRSAAPAAPAPSSSNSVGAPAPCPIDPSAYPFTAPTLTPSPLRPAKLMSARQRTARSTPYPRKLAPSAKGKHAKENGGEANLAAVVLKRKRDHGGMMGRVGTMP
ncbi:hypothetical protein B0H13DRAFT_2518201 [Mycena leptocephala]|nr:hypothetical protein B0H13DRAFT_2518201 [Mycena leptocephala]